MFKWMYVRRRKLDSAPEPSEVDRDSGEEEYESSEEAEREEAPSGMTRVKTANV